MQIKLLLCHCCAQFLETESSRLTAPQTQRNFGASRGAIANVHALFDYFRCAVSERIYYSSPIRVSSMPTGFYQRAISHGARRRICLGEVPCAVHPHRDKT